MNTDHLATLYTQASACAERLTLPLRSHIWRGMAGEFQGAGTGSSIDFQDHRAYMPGDDPRHINWQAFARTGNYTMKLYREEVRPLIDIILDASESMFFHPDKADRTAELLYCVTISAINAGASCQIHLLRGESSTTIPIDAVTSHRWFHTAHNLPAGKTPTTLALNTLQLRGNAIRVLISDLLIEGDPTPPLKLLNARQAKPIILAPYLPSEANPTWHGNYEFINIETGTHHPHRIEKSTLKHYRKAYNNHFSHWHTTAKRFNTPLARVPTHLPLLNALTQEATKSGALTLT